MTRDEITRMAREAGFIINAENEMTHSLERFAALAYASGAAAERDRMCEKFNIPKELAHEKAKGNEAD